MATKLRLLVCENFQPEVAAALAAEGFADVEVAVFPGCGGRARPDPDFWSGLMANLIAEGDPAHLIAGAYCAGSLATPREPAGLHVHRLDQCFHLLADRKLVDGYLENGAYLLTPGWLAQWRNHLRAWGFHPETAPEFFREFATRLLLLDTGVDARSAEHLAELARFADLPFEVVPVGLDLLRLFLARIVLEWRLESEKSRSLVDLVEAHRQSADYAMALDLIGGLTRITTEVQAIENALDLFGLLFAPDRLAYVSLVDGRIGTVQTRPASAVDGEATGSRLANLREDYRWSESGTGFVLRVGHQGEALGVLEVDGIAFPQYKEQYLNLTLTIVRVCGLAIANARTFEKVNQSEQEIRKLNTDLESWGRELAATNQELETFSYSVSHDLQAPLRRIDGFSQALLEDYSDRLDEQGQDYLRRVRAASLHMAQLIDDLLALSRLTRSDLHRQTVDLSALAAAVAADLQKGQPRRPVELAITPGLAANGDARLLRIVLENLLGNAWKFTAKHAQARIEFGVTESEGRAAFFVRDDGAGFDQAYADKLFGPFQRLHSADEFPGTGIGLATVQRIIHRHGGRIWAQGAVEHGATFYFTL